MHIKIIHFLWDLVFLLSTRTSSSLGGGTDFAFLLFETTSTSSTISCLILVSTSGYSSIGFSTEPLETNCPVGARSTLKGPYFLLSSSPLLVRNSISLTQQVLLKEKINILQYTRSWPESKLILNLLLPLGMRCRQVIGKRLQL